MTSLNLPNEFRERPFTERLLYCCKSQFREGKKGSFNTTVLAFGKFAICNELAQEICAHLAFDLSAFVDFPPHSVKRIYRTEKGCSTLARLFRNLVAIIFIVPLLPVALGKLSFSISTYEARLATPNATTSSLMIVKYMDAV